MLLGGEVVSRPEAATRLKRKEVVGGFNFLSSFHAPQIDRATNLATNPNSPIDALAWYARLQFREQRVHVDSWSGLILIKVFGKMQNDYWGKSGLLLMIWADTKCGNVTCLRKAGTGHIHTISLDHAN